MHNPALTLILAASLSSVSLLYAKDVKVVKKPKSAAKPELEKNAIAGAANHKWADWIEPDFPFFSSVLDARNVGEGFPKDNLTPRGIILNLGHNLWACFDTDLLRIACIWQGEEGKPPVTQNALAPGSYHIAGQKTKDGEEDLPQPIGKVWLANGIYPGWQVLKSPDDKLSFIDPREPGPDTKEVGRGSLDEKIGVFKGVASTKDGAVLIYEVGGIEVQEWLQFDEAHDLVVRSFKVDKSSRSLALTFSQFGDDLEVKLAKLSAEERRELEQRLGMMDYDDDHSVAAHFDDRTKKHRSVIIPVHNIPIAFALNFVVKKDFLPMLFDAKKFATPTKRAIWPQTITTKATLSQKGDAYVVDDIPLPLDNPWKRNVRLADIAFLNDKGDAAAVTMDGDVWLISGLNGDLREVKWKRFASGLHEPMSIVARSGSAGTLPASPKTSDTPAGSQRSQEDIFVFDRNGIWKLNDINGDGECDVYEIFCNKFAQTAESREFPSSMKLAPDGSFVISKGGQQGTYLGKNNGSVIRVSPDGKSYEVLGYGLRQPFLGVHPKTGLVVASDQEGHYVPTTPIHIIKDHQFYGHLAVIQPKEKYPQTIADPLTWIPHSVVPSGAALTWLTDAKMGSVNDELVLVSYNKPELHRVLTGSAGTLAGQSPPHSPAGVPALPVKPQATVVPWITNFDFPTLNAHINPADGQLYVTGFQIWGTTVKRISGLARIRYTGNPRVLLQECTPCDKGVLLRFNSPLEKSAATNPDNYNVERWNYKRTFNYGSPHLKADGTPGQEWMVPSSAYLSKDAKSVFIGLPNMKNTYMQMRVGYGLKGADGLPAQNNSYFTPYELTKFEADKEGFDNITVDLTPRKLVAVAAVKPTLDEGKRLYEMMGCIACHSIDGTVYGKVGPSWMGLYGSERVLAKGGDKATADDAYLKESILNPPAKVVKGYEKLDAGMPIYSGVLNVSQVESLILFIKSLK